MSQSRHSHFPAKPAAVALPATAAECCLATGVTNLITTWCKSRLAEGAVE